MNSKYKNLMIQYGGYIPFSILGGVHKKKSHKKKISHKKKKSHKKKISHKKTKRVLSNKYSIGTIIRKNNKLMVLSKKRKWVKLKE